MSFRLCDYLFESVFTDLGLNLFSINGQPPITQATLQGYITYVSGFYVVNVHNKASKHYYAGSERISSRLAGNAVTSPTIGTEEELDLLKKRHALDWEYIVGLFNINFTIQVPQPIQYDLMCSEYYVNNPELGKQCDCDLNSICTDLLYYFHPDHVGSSTFLSDINGQPYQFLLYLPFGETMAEQNVAGWATPYQFNAKELDENTGLYYYGARYYDPRISLWHGVDPLADRYPNWSPFVYTMNNPVRYSDPTGMSTEEGGGDPPANVLPEVTITAQREKGVGQSILKPIVSDSYSSGAINIKRESGEKAPYTYSASNGMNISGDGSTMASSITSMFVNNENILVNRFMMHWKFGGGQDYNLSEYENYGLIGPYNLARPGEEGKDLRSVFSTLKEGESRYVSFNVPFVTNQSATVGNATLVHSGVLSKIKGLWYFKGTASIFDTYNFDLRDSRSSANWRATFMGKIANGGGRIFNVKGPSFPVQANQLSPVMNLPRKNGSDLNW